MNPLLEQNNDWRMITSVLTDVLDAQFGVTVLPSVSANQVRPVIENVSAEQYRLVIPIGEESGKPVVAVGTLDAKPGEILEKMLGLAVRYVHQGRRLEEQLLDLEAYARQISRDFEELTWLRGLLQRLKDRHGAAASAGDEQRPADAPVQNLAKSILAPLCPLVGTQQIILVSASPSGEISNAPPNGQQSGAPGQEVPPVGKVVVRVGAERQIIDDQSCCELVDRLRQVAGAQSLVQTGMKRRREFSMVPAVDSCILVPVTGQESLLGWLLAVNRISDNADSNPTSGSSPASPPENGFGTLEANLLDFAAIILAAHSRCAELFGQGADRARSNESAT